MTKNSNVLALRIAQILEEYTAKEIAEAISTLRKCDTTSELLTYLAAATKPSQASNRRKGSAAEKRPKPIDQVTSKAVRDLEKTDPDKYQLLLEFDSLLRQGRLLETNDAVRRFGEFVSKDFRSRTARKDNISALMTSLARLDESELRKSLKRAFENPTSQKSDEYQRLARFLMSGN
ncbi:hypothetical protein [uncultured Tateyamaria sp.]|uniref:hypothetical protein n=1 Tax=uncultured Tateyamaria sp. TaxID=455651 RepID=UPI0026334FA3|nr:hypothetical protein [uncultured Tateyamaria sp.]